MYPYCCVLILFRQCLASVPLFPGGGWRPGGVGRRSSDPPPQDGRRRRRRGGGREVLPSAGPSTSPSPSSISRWTVCARGPSLLTACASWPPLPSTPSWCPARGPGGERVHPNGFTLHGQSAFLIHSGFLFCNRRSLTRCLDFPLHMKQGSKECPPPRAADGTPEPTLHHHRLLHFYRDHSDVPLHHPGRGSAGAPLSCPYLRSPPPPPLLACKCMFGCCRRAD